MENQPNGFGALSRPTPGDGLELEWMRRNGVVKLGGDKQGGLVQMLSGFASNPFGALSRGYDAVTSDPIGVANQFVVQPVVDQAKWINNAMRGRVPLTNAQGRMSQDAIQRSMDIGGMFAGGNIANTAVRGGQMPNTFGMLGGGDAAKKGIKAYHGSPHSFDKFSMDAIGTGEGAQAYGHGLYFAENEGVAKGYRDALTHKAGFPDNPEEFAANVLHRNDGDANAAYKDILKWRKSSDNKEVQDMANAALDLLDENPPSPKPPGSMYEVNINADPEDFLDWDKPLSADSPQNVKDAWNSIANSDPELKTKLHEAYRNQDSGAILYSLLEAKKGDRVLNQTKATDRLREAGIPGIKYLDQGSRGAGNGSRNYVVFDDSMVEILRKYGIIPTGISAAMLNESLKDDPQSAQELFNIASGGA